MNYKRFLGAASTALMTVIVIFSLAPGAWAQSNFKTLHKFTGSKDGGSPVAGLIFDTAGNLYGTTSVGGNLSDCNGYGCGVVFELIPNADGRWTEKVLRRFTGAKDGATPYSSVIFDQAGNLYGTTQTGGATGCWYYWTCGVVFELTPNANGTWKEKVLHTFHGPDGGLPYAGLVLDGGGNLYGTTQRGGSQIYGVVFELMPSADGSWKEKQLHRFTSGKDGAFPDAGLIFDQAGNLYSTASNGACDYGACGDVFELMPNPNGSWKIKILHYFSGESDGYETSAGLVFDAAGNLYGTSAWGGGKGSCWGARPCGVVFELTPNVDGSWTEHVLHQFTGGEDGGNPEADLILDSAGNLYGTAAVGGAHGYGVVFKLAPNANGGWDETVLHSFMDKPGANPQSALIFDPAGNLYGTTAGDGKTTFGSVFEITP
jgi:uncharacterized repeat protein (TIGR03803 family)